MSSKKVKKKVKDKVWIINKKGTDDCVDRIYTKRKDAFVDIDKVCGKQYRKFYKIVQATLTYQI